MANLIFGCGYLGLPVAQLWRQAGQPVIAVTRSAERARKLAAEGIEPLVADITADPLPPFAREIRTVLFAVGYDRAAGHSIHDVYVGGLARVITSLPESIERLIYISSTGVYGTSNRSEHCSVPQAPEVDEDSPCHPTREGGKACLAAEQLLQSSCFAERSIILRLAGIYGPGRIPRSADLIAGRPIDAPAEGWLNLIHVADAARIVLAAEEEAPLPRTYVVSDGHPVVRRDYYAELARLLQAPPPQFITPAADSPTAARAASDKRVQPQRMFHELRPRLQYPSYQQGLAAIVSNVA